MLGHDVLTKVFDRRIKHDFQTGQLRRGRLDE
jgi:hypothetical protein